MGLGTPSQETRAEGEVRPNEYNPAEGLEAARWTPIGEVAAWPRNPKDHTAEHVEAIRASLDRFGWAAPLVANSRTGQLVAGHGRLLAALERRDEFVPVRWIDLSEDDAELLALADNRLNEIGGYREEKLAEILRRRSETDRDGLRIAGYDDAALAALLRNALEPPPTPATEWVGMPEYESTDLNSHYRVTVHFRTEEDVAAFFALVGQTKRSSTWYPESDGHVGSDVHKQYVAEESEDDVGFPNLDEVAE